MKIQISLSKVERNFHGRPSINPINNIYEFSKYEFFFIILLPVLLLILEGIFFFKMGLIGFFCLKIPTPWAIRIYTLKKGSDNLK